MMALEGTGMPRGGVAMPAGCRPSSITRRLVEPNRGWRPTSTRRGLRWSAAAFGMGSTVEDPNESIVHELVADLASPEKVSAPFSSLAMQILILPPANRSLRRLHRHGFALR